MSIVRAVHISSMGVEFNLVLFQKVNSPFVNHPGVAETWKNNLPLFV